MNKAIERILALVDKDSLKIMDDMEPSIHVLAKATISGKLIYCCAGIPEACKIDIHECFRRKITWLETILNNPAPVIWLHDSPPQVPGGRTPIPANSDVLLASNSGGVGRAFCLQARLNSITPQISVLFGDCGAAQTFPVKLADFTLLKTGSHMWIGRPDSVKFMLGKAPDPELLGGAEMHCKLSGVGDKLFDDEAEAFEWIQRCVKLLPQKSGLPLPQRQPLAPIHDASLLDKIIPEDLNTPFAIQPVIDSLIDANSWVEMQELYAREVVAGIAAIAGNTVGIIANNSLVKGGVLYPESCRKIVRMIKFCDTYKIPMLFLADNPGLMVGEASEQGGMITEAAELIRTLANCKTDRACLVVRKAYTVGLYAMSGPGFDPAHFWASPHASISVFGPKALDLFASDRDLPPPALEAIKEMRHHAIDPHDYAEKGLLSGVIEWRDIRSHLENFVQESITKSDF